MSDQATEIRSLKERIALLESIVLHGKPYTPGLEEWHRVVEAFAAGDNAPYIAYVERGGIIPKPSGNKNGRRSGRQAGQPAGGQARCAAAARPTGKPDAGRRHLGSGSSSPS